MKLPANEFKKLILRGRGPISNGPQIRIPFVFLLYGGLGFGYFTAALKPILCIVLVIQPLTKRLEQVKLLPEYSVWLITLKCYFCWIYGTRGRLLVPSSGTIIHLTGLIYSVISIWPIIFAIVNQVLKPLRNSPQLESPYTSASTPLRDSVQGPWPESRNLA